MDLYIGLTEHYGGLGYLDGRAPELTLTLDLVPPAAVPPSDADAEYAGKRRMRRKDKTKVVESVSLDVVVTQDPGALRARSGETGSVLWRSRCVITPLGAMAGPALAGPVSFIYIDEMMIISSANHPVSTSLGISSPNPSSPAPHPSSPSRPCRTHASSNSVLALASSHRSSLRSPRTT